MSTKPLNHKDERALTSFDITIRDRDHFYKIVHWLNDNIGKGSQHWSMKGKILRKLPAGSVKTTVYIFDEGFDDYTCSYLSLL